MEVRQIQVFQTDSLLIKNHLISNSNYIIEYNESVKEEYCVVYFSSNDLYYPNTEISFKETVISKNRYEWYGNRINYAHKHIFIRDIQKQWYLGGINHQINTPQKLTEFLKKESEGYKLIFVGSSAGGFASVIFGQFLNAEKIFSFNGQFEINSILHKSIERKDPLIFRFQNNLVYRPFYDALNFITNPSSIYYFHSSRSNWDNEQNRHVLNIKINRISFKTKNHGLPFLKTNLPIVLNMNSVSLNKFVGEIYHPFLFSIKLIGFRGTILGLLSIINFIYNKIYINTIQKLKKIK